MKTIIDKHSPGKRLSHMRALMNKEKSLLNTEITYDGVEYVGILQKV